MKNKFFAELSRRLVKGGIESVNISHTMFIFTPEYPCTIRLRMPYSCGYGIVVSCALTSSLSDSFAGSPICMRLNTVASTRMELL